MKVISRATTIDTSIVHHCLMAEMVINLGYVMVTLVLLRWQKFATRSVAVFCLTHHGGVGAGGECLQYALHWGCGSIVCPVPFPSRLIAPHTSTATTVVNNTDTTRRDGRGS